MKLRQLVLPTILATAVALTGCQESPTAIGEIDPESTPRFGHKPGHNPGGGGGGGGGGEQNQYDVVLAGDLSGGGTGHDSGGGLNQIVVPADFDTSFLNAAFGGQCFVAAPTLESGSLALTLNNEGGIDVVSSFHASGTDGSDVQYRLSMPGSLESGDWLPTGTSVVRLTTWSVQKDAGKGKKVACEGEGVFSDATATVTLLQ